MMRHEITWAQAVLSGSTWHWGILPDMKHDLSY